MRRAGLLLLLAACGEARPSSPTVKLVQDLGLLVQGEPLDDDDAERWAEQLDAGQLSPEVLVDHLLASPLVGDRVAEQIVLGGATGDAKRAVPGYAALRQYEDARGRKVYTLREHCPVEEEQSVTPWWNPGGKVWICQDSLREDVRGDGQGRSCGASTLDPDQTDVCGCGPWLMYCTGDDEAHDELERDSEQEVDDTIAWVVNQDIPLDELFLMNETVRGRNAELLYRRAAVAAGADPKILDLRDFPKKPTLEPREELYPGQHAGILTAPAMVYSSDALRGTMRNYYDALWCTGQASSGVTTEAVLGLDVVDLRAGDGWRQLAAMPICTDCHARLDYGMQFFHGYPSSTYGIDFRPQDALPGEGPLYGHNIDDPLGVDDLSPQGFGRLLLDAPEFSACMSRRVTDHVFAGSSTAEDYEAIHDAFEETRSLKPALRVALLRYMARALGEGQDSDAPSEEAAPARAVAELEPRDGALAPSPRLQTLVDDNCASCHDGAEVSELGDPLISRDLALRMLEQVAFDEMPRTAEGMDAATRRAFVDELVDMLWTSPDQRDIAREFFGGGMRAYATHDVRPALAAVASRAGEPGDRPTLRAADASAPRKDQRYSPGFVAMTALVALRECREAGVAEDELQACVERASDPAALTLGTGP